MTEVSAQDRLYDLALELLEEGSVPKDLREVLDQAIRDWRMGFPKQ